MMAASISRSCGGSGSRRWICLLSMVEGLYTPEAKIDEVLKLKAPGAFRLEGGKVNISRLLVLFSFTSSTSATSKIKMPAEARPAGQMTACYFSPRPLRRWPLPGLSVPQQVRNRPGLLLARSDSRRRQSRHNGQKRLDVHRAR